MSQERDIIVTGTYFSCASDALKFVLSAEYWPAFWAWIIAGPPDAGMDEATTRAWMTEARDMILDRLTSLEAELEVIRDR